MRSRSALACVICCSNSPEGCERNGSFRRCSWAALPAGSPRKKISFENLRDAGLPLGSGAVMVFDDSADLRDVLERLAHFFADESCGKCYPCQLGSQRQHEILHRSAAGQPIAGDRERLSDIGGTMIDASLCGLGQTAPAAVLSAMKLWPEMFEEVE